MLHRLLLLTLLLASVASASAPWEEWLHNFGHDTYDYPEWVKEQMTRCRCVHGATSSQCEEQTAGEWRAVDLRAPSLQFTYCSSKQWLLDHMPPFDKAYLPPSVSQTGTSMFDDNIAFALMANKASPWGSRLPVKLQLSYILPYGGYHEARDNWRPLYFAKLFHLVAGVTTTQDAVRMLAGLGSASPLGGGTGVGRDVPPSRVSDWTANVWADYPPADENVTGKQHLEARWVSSSNPPVISPFEFIAYGYGSCTAWATMLVSAARALGIPARQSGTPCWNSGEFAGLAMDNGNVSYCWRGGNSTFHGGKFLYNHNWVEYWDEEVRGWRLSNVPDPNYDIFNYDPKHGCGYSNVTGCSAVTGGPGAGMRDHELLSASWTLPGEEDEYDGGPVVTGADFVLSSGEKVSPLVWSPNFASPLGQNMAATVRFINRTAWYRCRE